MRPRVRQGRPTWGRGCAATRPSRSVAIFQRTARAISALLFVLSGLTLALLGIAAALDQVSLRGLLLDMELWQAFRLAERVHALLRPRMVDPLELGFGLVGLAVLGAATWWLTSQSRPRG